MIEKKRTNLRRNGNLLDFPEQIMDRKKFGYRWRARSLLEKNSDGYDPDGWEVFKTQEGKTVVRDDLILVQMPIEDYQEMVALEKKEKADQMALFFENQAADEDRATHEFKKKGGKVKFTFSQD